jgi:hypothetical protein
VELITGSKPSLLERKRGGVGFVPRQLIGLDVAGEAAILQAGSGVALYSRSQRLRGRILDQNR